MYACSIGEPPSANLPCTSRMPAVFADGVGPRGPGWRRARHCRFRSGVSHRRVDRRAPRNRIGFVSRTILSASPAFTHAVSPPVQVPPDRRTGRDGGARQRPPVRQCAACNNAFVALALRLTDQALAENHAGYDPLTAGGGSVIARIGGASGRRATAGLRAFEVRRLNACDADLLASSAPQWTVAVMDTDHVTRERRQYGTGQQYGNHLSDTLPNTQNCGSSCKCIGWVKASARWHACLQGPGRAGNADQRVRVTRVLIFSTTPPRSSNPSPNAIFQSS